MPKFTLGKWWMRSSASGNIVDENGKSVCLVRMERQDGTSLGNAALIATAPELFAALKAVEWIQDGESGTGEFSVCAWCGNWKADGHTKDCQDRKSVV